jgi:hypothetical protein
MQYRIVVRAALAVALATALGAALWPARQSVNAAAALTPGKADLKSAGALTFGPDGVLFVGDSIGGAVVALDTADRTPVRTAAINVEAVDQKIAALVGHARSDHGERCRRESYFQERLRVGCPWPRA